MTALATTGGPNGPLAAGGLFSPTAVQTSAYTASPGDFVPVDSTSGAVTVTLPTAPADATMVSVKMIGTGHNVTVAAGGADVLNKAAGPTSLALTTQYQTVYLQYHAANSVWYVLDGMNLAGGYTAVAYSAPAVVALTDAATITTNAALGNDFRVTLGGNRTLANPTNPVDGQKITYQVTQDATGSRTLTYGSAFDFGTPGSPTLTTTAAKTDILRFVYNAAATKWYCEGSTLGF